MRRIVVRLAVAAFAVAAAGVVVAAPAQATTCTTGHGVSVVVDFNRLGGGVQSACDVSGAGRTATTQLTDVGHSLTYVQRQPGFVCRIDGLPQPASDACVVTPPADAYWSLWWSDGRSGTWTYASSGAAGLTVPDGGYVGLSWQSGDAKSPPGVAPRTHPSASPTPTRHPSSAPTRPPSSPPPESPSTAPSSAGSPGTTAGAPGRPAHHPRSHPASTKASKKAGRRPARSSGGDHADPPLDRSAAPVSASTSSDDGGLPGWVAPAAVLALFAAAGTVVVVRRRGSGGA